ncbi:MAG: RHS repeat-associated core domain-containing protein, partial [Thermoanaerobaculia bacterium]|nr:RHS repeat-associated core domain-containing protein [Thermoanaerobaculia bacterium]
LQSYLFDRYGNLKETTTQIGTGTPVTRTAPVVVTTNRFSNGLYDAFGNVTSYSAQSYAWDVLRTMRGTPGKILLYGPGDERIWEFAYTSSAASTFRETFSLRGLGGQVLREYRDIGGNSTGNWSLAEEFIYRDGQLLASVTPTQTTHYTLDHLGTPRLATGNGGTTLAYHAYFPFGEEATNPGQNAQRMKFTGHQRDNLGGGLTDDLDYMHARYGTPMTGRFLSLDPVLGYPEDPQSWNRYAYVMGNPLLYTDPLGLAINCVTNQGGQDGTSGRCVDDRTYVFVIDESSDSDVMSDETPKTVLEHVDNFMFQFSRPALTVMVGILNDSPSQVVAGEAQMLGDALGQRIGGTLLKGVLSRVGPKVAGAAQAVDPNKLHHIFDKAGRNLGPLVAKFGSQEGAFLAVREAAQAAVSSQGLSGTFRTTVKVGEYTITVKGSAIDGIAHIGTFW